MPKLPSLSPKKVIMIVTVPYHSSQEVARGTLIQILEDAGISREELQDLL